MSKFFLGVVVGVSLLFIVLNPSGAKKIAATTIDNISSAYQDGSKVLNEGPPR